MRPLEQVTSQPVSRDEELVASFRSGEKQAFNALVLRYQRELFHFLVRFMGNRADAEDVFQETWVQVCRSAENFDPTRRFRPWLFTIAANKGRDFLRNRTRKSAVPLHAEIDPNAEDTGTFEELMEDDTPPVDRSLIEQENQAVVQRVIATMPGHLRELLALSYFHRFPYKQIAEIMDVPLGTVKSRLHAAVKEFGDRYSAAIHEAPDKRHHGSHYYNAA